MMYFRAMNWTDLHAFDANTKDQWLKAIQKELGERNLESLHWSPASGVTMEPYYTSSSRVAWRTSGVAPFLIHQAVEGNTPEVAREEALACLMGGAQSIGFDGVPNDFDWDAQLKGIEWPYIQLHWHNFPLEAAAVTSLTAYATSRGWEANQLRGCFGIDASHLWKGTWNKEVVQALRHHFPMCRIFVITERSFAGNQTDHQLVGLLAQVQEALHALVSAGFSIDEASAMVQIQAELSTSYFQEITKLRVLRHLYGELVEAYGPQHACSTSIWIHAKTSSMAYAEVDTDTNLLRATTMAMSAAIGQSSSIEIHPHDASHPRVDSLRWSRNMLHLLREESYFDQAIHAANGSHYLESFAQQLATVVWSQLHAIEDAGGWRAQEEVWLRAAEQMAQAHQARIASGEIIQVGVNKYQPKAHAKN